MNRERIRQIFFDAAGTLFRLRESVGSGYARVGKAFGIRLDPAAAEAAFREAWKSAGSPWPSASEHPEKAWWRGIVSRVVELCGQTMNEDYFEALWNHYAKAETWELFEETREVLRQLRDRGLRLGVISNFDERLLSILDGHGVAGFFDPIVISSEVGARKPSPEIFASALASSECAASECLHVGDEPEADWRGAAEAGMRIFKLRRPEITLRQLLNHSDLA